MAQETAQRAAQESAGAPFAGERAQQTYSWLLVPLLAAAASVPGACADEALNAVGVRLFSRCAAALRRIIPQGVQFTLRAGVSYAGAAVQEAAMDEVFAQGTPQEIQDFSDATAAAQNPRRQAPAGLGRPTRAAQPGGRVTADLSGEVFETASAANGFATLVSPDGRWESIPASSLVVCFRPPDPQAAHATPAQGNAAGAAAPRHPEAAAARNARDHARHTEELEANRAAAAQATQAAQQAREEAQRHTAEARQREQNAAQERAGGPQPAGQRATAHTQQHAPGGEPPQDQQQTAPRGDTEHRAQCAPEGAAQQDRHHDADAEARREEDRAAEQARNEAAQALSMERAARFAADLARRRAEDLAQRRRQTEASRPQAPSARQPAANASDDEEITWLDGEAPGQGDDDALYVARVAVSSSAAAAPQPLPEVVCTCGRRPGRQGRHGLSCAITAANAVRRAERIAYDAGVLPTTGLLDDDRPRPDSQRAEPAPTHRPHTQRAEATPARADSATARRWPFLGIVGALRSF